MTAALTPEQEASRAWLVSHPRGLLIAGMGTGKTWTTLRALADLPAGAFPALVLAPPTVSESTWSDEAERRSIPLAVEAAPRTPAAKRRAALADTLADVVVLSSASIRDAVLSDTVWRTVVVDEASQYMTPSASRGESQRARALRELAAAADRLWLLTGTPGHDPVGVWSLVRMLDGGERLGKTVTRARDEYLTEGRMLPTGARVGREPRPGAMKRLIRKASDVMRYAEAGDELVLPEVGYQALTPVMGREAERMSRELLADGVTHLPDGREVYTSGPGAVANLMHQLTTGAIWYRPPLDPDAEPELVQVDRIRPALDYAASCVRARRQVTGRGVLVMTWFRHEEPYLRAQLREMRIGSAKRAEDREAFNAGNLDVLIAHPASAGHGLNLQFGGESLVWTCLPWSLELWEQANARLARPGQTAKRVSCQFNVPVYGRGEPSIAAAIWDALGRKADIQRTVFTTLGLSDEEHEGTNLTEPDVPTYI
jgi:hypothetical protein